MAECLGNADKRGGALSPDSLRLYAVTDAAWLGERSLEFCVGEALAGGATFVQLRMKEAETHDRLRVARALLPLCRKAHAPLVINDDVQAALLSGADGVHVGQRDESCKRARQVLGPDAIVGVSVQTLDQALDAQAAGASYLGVGAIFPTRTKTDADLVSLEVLRTISESVAIPVVAIGGITLDTLPLLMFSGVEGVAVVSALFAAQDIALAARMLRKQVTELVGG